MGSLIAILVIAFAAFVVILLIVLYNRFVRLRNRADNAWAQVDVQLRRRYDLIPNLVETVKGYASHERETFERVTQARSAGIEARTVNDQAQAENMLTQALGRLFALSEAYPNLKADTSFLRLQEELSSTENKISFARQHYNDSVGRYETSRQVFPTNIVAGAFNFQARQYFEIEAAEAREAPKVSFT